MERQKTYRKQHIELLLTIDEYAGLEKNWKKSTIKNRSEYVRRVLFGKPVTVYTRNKSLDDFMAEMILLRRELNAIGENVNQAVRRLHTLDYLPQMQLWLNGLERDKTLLFNKVAEIKSRIDLIADQWLQ
jgi:hypothetical protein